MKKVLLVTAASLLAAPLSAAVLDFAGDICEGGMPCSNFDFVDQSYGSMTGVDITYNAVSTAFDATNERFQYFSSTFGGGMTDVIITNASFSEIYFEAQAGYEVSLGGLDLGTFGPNAAPGGITVSVFDLFDDGLLFTSGNVAVAGGGPINIDFDESSTTGLKIVFGGNLPNIAVDNISYDAVLIDTPAPIPLPASAWLLAAGVAAFGLNRKRRV